MKRFLAMLLCAVLVFAFAAACANDTPAPSSGGSPSQSQSPSASPSASPGAGSSSGEPADTGNNGMLGNMYLTGYPIVEEKVTLRFTACRWANCKNDFKDMLVFQQYEELTNVNIDWIEIEEASWVETTRLMLATLDLPDAFYGWPIADDVILTYGEQGILLPLNDLIDTYAPNMLFGMEVYPMARPAMTYPDGNIYSVPMQNMSAIVANQNVTWINEDWLNLAGMSMPQTTEDLYDVLKAFKGLYPDQYPFTFQMFAPNGLPSMGQSIVGMFGSWGIHLNDRYVMFNDWGEVVFAPAQPGYLEALRYFNRLYSEGLLDPESFTQTQQQMEAKTRDPESPGVGMTISNLIGMHTDWSARQQGYTETLEDFTSSFNYETKMSGTRYKPMGPLQVPGAATPIFNPMMTVQGANSGRFAITNVCKTPEVAMRWVDTFCDNVYHANNIRFGPQGMFWDYDQDGDIVQLNPPQDLPGTPYDLDTTFNPLNYCVWWWWAIDRPQKHAPNNVYNINYVQVLYTPFVTRPAVPPLKFTIDETATLSSIQVDLFTFVNSSLANFILYGVTDSQWDNYLRDLRRYGMDTFIDLYKTGYNRIDN